MSVDIIGVQDFNIFALGAEAVSYSLKDIHTVALQVTPENIGILALELAVELKYSNEGVPSFHIWAERGTEENPERERSLVFRATDWIVILWDEIHLYRDFEFRHTFSFDRLSAPPAVENKKDFERVAEDITDRAMGIVETSMVGPGVSPVGEKTEIIGVKGELDTDEANRQTP